MLLLSAGMHQVYETGRAVGTERDANKAKQAMASSAFPRPNVIISIVHCDRAHCKVLLWLGVVF